MTLSQRLLAWYDKNARKLPWRETPHPYYILVSEFMLQQTRMETVLPYFDQFISVLPTLDNLADASEEELLKLWEGLGYYRRVRHLHQSAKIIQAKYQSTVPSDPVILQSLPGIGEYVAGAIASTAYQVRVSAIDGNVIRILTRLTCNHSDVTKAATKKQLQLELLEHLPEERVGDFNQALMELGALICLPNGDPLCHDCPISYDCCGYKTSTALDYPVKPKKVKLPTEKKTVFVIISPHGIQLEQFEPGLLEGLWRFPMQEGHRSLEEVYALYPEARISALPKSSHRFSHKIWDMIGYKIELNSGEDHTPLTELASRTFPTALRVYRQLVDSQ